MSLRFKPLERILLENGALRLQHAARHARGLSSQQAKTGLAGGPASLLIVQRGKKKGGLTRPADEKVART
jgi:hypothetical protein